MRKYHSYSNFSINNGVYQRTLKLKLIRVLCMPLSKIVVPDGGIKTARKEKKDNIPLSEN